MRVLKPNVHNRIKAMISEGFTFAHIKETILAKKITVTYQDVVNVFYSMMNNPVRKPSITINSTKQRYYDTEQDIFDSMDLKYGFEDLKGWERQRFEFLEAEDKRIDKKQKHETRNTHTGLY